MEDVGTFIYTWSIHGLLLYVFYGHWVQFVVIWYILPVLVFCTKKNLATLSNYASIRHTKRVNLRRLKSSMAKIDCMTKIGSFYIQGFSFKILLFRYVYHFYVLQSLRTLWQKIKKNIVFKNFGLQSHCLNTTISEYMSPVHKPGSLLGRLREKSPKFHALMKVSHCQVEMIGTWMAVEFSMSSVAVAMARINVSGLCSGSIHSLVS
jgi:hypothetical protein